MKEDMKLVVFILLIQSQIFLGGDGGYRCKV